MAGEPIFQMYKLSKVYPPDREVLKDISLSFLPGAKIGVLGYNGSGKSSLLRIMAGRDNEFRGDAQLAPGASVGLLEQEPALDETKNVRENVLEGVGHLARAARALQRARRQLHRGDRRRVRAPAGRDRRRRRVEPRRDDRARDGRAALPAGRRRRSDTLSGGERRRVALCRLLLSQPDLLLLDEPTNHLDAESVEWLERHLAEYKGTVVAVTHDRYFLDNVAGWILELDRGRGIPYQGNYSGWLEQKQERLAQNEKQEIARQRTIAAELEWVRTNPKGRRTKSKARLANYEALLAAGGRRQARPGADPHPGRDRGSATS